MNLVERVHREKMEIREREEIESNEFELGLKMTNGEVNVFMNETCKQEEWLNEMIRDYHWNRFQHWSLEDIEIMKFLLQFKPELFSQTEENE